MIETPTEPVLPDLSLLCHEREKICAIQQYIEQFEYNYAGKPFLKLKKSGGAAHIDYCVKELIRISLPIQCVEAVFIACSLTAELKTIERIPLSFKSVFRGNVHRHIVLAVKHEDKWAAIGISRRPNLMDKPFEFDSLLELIREYEISYENCFHKLLTVYIGLPLPREFSSNIPIKWRAVKIRLFAGDSALISKSISQYCENMHDWYKLYVKEESLPSL